MKPRWIVCEDGDEYLTRFSRFLGDRFEFTPASDLSDALAAAPGAQGLLLDLDFRRTDPARLVDEGIPLEQSREECGHDVVGGRHDGRRNTLPGRLTVDCDPEDAVEEQTQRFRE